jgi:hypothetical protein
MNAFQVYDPAMCCSSGVCGPEVDPRLVRFAADLKWLHEQGVEVQRFNLSQSPAAFVENEQVKQALTEMGEGALPMVIGGGRVFSTGRYPERHELAGWAGAALGGARAESDPCCGAEEAKGEKAGASKCCG